MQIVRDTVEKLVNDLGGVEALSEFDLGAVRAVAGLLDRVADARRSIEAEGILVDGRENPACLTERTASAELRGWVKDRPDLFGRRKTGVGAATGGGLGLKEQFKVVK